MNRWYSSSPDGFIILSFRPGRTPHPSEYVNKINPGLAPLLQRDATGRYDGYQRLTARTIPVVVVTPDAQRSAVRFLDRPAGGLVLLNGW
jgi:hypothetical protein